MNQQVLLTGISGFLGAHVALELLGRGYYVRGSVRNASQAERVRRSLVKAGATIDRLEFCELDLLSDRGWDEAAEGCHFLQHVASPFVLTMPKDENELIRPAVDGTRRAINAALRAGHERLVVTSSLAAIDGGRRQYKLILTSEDWTVLDGPHVTSYAKSKTLAERCAWELVDRANARERLAVINPGTLLGPLLDDDLGASGLLVQRLLTGAMPMLPNLLLPYVDVRDVALALVQAMCISAAGGHRHILTNAVSSLWDIAATLRERVPERAQRVPTRHMPAPLARLFSIFDKSLRDSRTYLGVRRQYRSTSGDALIGHPRRSTGDALEAMARSLIERELV
jgi:nucleoside-diphosphate-sugar epimerase